MNINKRFTLLSFISEGKKKFLATKWPREKGV